MDILLCNAINEGRKLRWAEGERPHHRDRLTGEVEFRYQILKSVTYIDRQLGKLHFTGTELLCVEGKPAWSMVYAGGMEKGYEQMADATYEFLRDELQSGIARFPGNSYSSHRGMAWEYHYKKDDSEMVRRWIDDEWRTVYHCRFLYASFNPPR